MTFEETGLKLPTDRFADRVGHTVDQLRETGGKTLIYNKTQAAKARPLKSRLSNTTAERAKWPAEDLRGYVKTYLSGNEKLTAKLFLDVTGSPTPKGITGTQFGDLHNRLLDISHFNHFHHTRIEGDVWLDGRTHSLEMPECVLQDGAQRINSALRDEKSDINQFSKCNVSRQFEADFPRQDYRLNGKPTKLEGAVLSEPESGPAFVKAVEKEIAAMESDDSAVRKPPRREDVPKLTAIINQSLYGHLCSARLNQPDSPFPYGIAGKAKGRVYHINTTEKPGVYDLRTSYHKNIQALAPGKFLLSNRLVTTHESSNVTESYSLRIDLNNEQNPVSALSGSVTYCALESEGSNPYDL